MSAQPKLSKGPRGYYNQMTIPTQAYKIKTVGSFKSCDKEEVGQYDIVSANKAL